MKSVYKTFKKGGRRSGDQSSQSDLSISQPPKAPGELEDVPCNKCTNYIIGKVFVVEGQRICGRCRDTYEAAKACEMDQGEFDSDNFASPNLELALAEMEEHADSEESEPEEAAPVAAIPEEPSYAYDASKYKTTKKKKQPEMTQMDMDLLGEINFDQLNLDLESQLTELDTIESTSAADVKKENDKAEKQKKEAEFAAELEKAEKEAAAAALVESLLGGLDSEFESYETGAPQEDVTKKVNIVVGDGFYEEGDEYIGLDVADFDDELLPVDEGVPGEEMYGSDEDCPLEEFFKTGIRPAPVIEDIVSNVEDEDTGLGLYDSSEYQTQETSTEDLIILRSKNIKQMRKEDAEKSAKEMEEYKEQLLKAAHKPLSNSGSTDSLNQTTKSFEFVY